MNPTDIYTYVDRFFLDHHHPLALEVDRELRVTSLMGSAEHFGYRRPEPGEPIIDCMPFLEGMLETQEYEPTVLPLVTVPGGFTAHIHLFRTQDGYGILFIDASEEHDRLQVQQQLSNELQLLKKRQEKLLEELSLANTAKSRFIANMSHEFRTPLTSVLGYAELLHETFDRGSEAALHINAIERNAQHLLVMIDNLLDQARIEANELQISQGHTLLEQVAQDIRGMIIPLTQQKRLGFTLRLDPDAPEVVLIDEMRLRQLLINLTGNAVKYTGSGEIRTEIAWRDGILDITVRDTGPGIPESEWQTIFEPFRQVDGEKREKGAGLGLSISRELARVMGGELMLVNSSDRGSLFSLTLPAPEVTPDNTPALLHSAEEQILVVEDDPDIQQLLTFHLQSFGYTLAICTNGEEAVNHTITNQPDLILMDLNMPVMDGYEAVRHLRQNGLTTPIIAMTAATSEQTRRDALEAGFDECLQKPIDASMLRNTVAARLSH